MSDERSKEPTSGSTVSAPSGQNTPDPTNLATTGASADGQTKRDLPTWGHGKSKRRRKSEDDQAAAAIEGMPSMEALDRGVVKVGQPIFRNVTTIVIGLFAVAAAVAGLQYWRGQGDASNAVATRSLAQGLAPLSRGVVIPKDDKDPEAMTNPWARSRKELRDRAASALSKAEGEAGSVALSAGLAKASLAMRQGDAKAAKAGYESFLAKAPANHPLRETALEALALAMEQSGELKEALAKFSALAQQENPRIQWHLGRVQHALGDKNAAKSALEKASAGKAGGLEAQLAKSLLASMDAPTPAKAAPSDVAPPKAAPDAAPSGSGSGQAKPTP